MPAALMIGRHFSISTFWKLAAASGPKDSSVARSAIVGKPGLEAQGDWADLSNQRVSLFNPLFSPCTKTDGIALFTGPIGYAWNAALLYVMGGAAVTSNRVSILSAVTGAELAAARAPRWGGKRQSNELSPGLPRPRRRAQAARQTRSSQYGSSPTRRPAGVGLGGLGRSTLSDARCPVLDLSRYSVGDKIKHLCRTPLSQGAKPAVCLESSARTLRA
jgi:hypothetical protein